MGMLICRCYTLDLNCAIPRSVLNLLSKDWKFDCPSNRYRLVIIGWITCLLTIKPSKYMTNTKVN